MKLSIAHYLSNFRLVFFGYAAIIILGIFAWNTISREMMPSIKLPMILVATGLPGASPNDVEQLVTIPLEDNIRTISGVDEYQSSSMENLSLSLIQFEESLSLDEAKKLVQEKVDATILPDDATTPIVNTLDFTEIPVWTFVIEGQDKVGLTHLAEKIQDELERQPTIDRVEVSGLTQREIVVYFDPSTLTNLGLNPALISQIIAAASSTIPAGSVTTGDFSYAVSLSQSVTDIATLRSLPLVINSTTYRLGDLASIYETQKPLTGNAYQASPNGPPSQIVALSVYKVAGEPIDTNAQLAKTITNQIIADYPQFSLKILSDYGEELADTFAELQNNIIATIILVFLVMLFFLGLREALISITCVPLTMLFTFIGMAITGLTLNFISLFSLLLVLGMLVDNAIVITTALSRAYQADPQKNALRAGVKVWREFFTTLISTNLTTVWAFLPIILVTGMMGQFLHPISIVVTLAIIGSALIGFLLTLPLGILILHFRLPTRIQKLLLGLFLLLATLAIILATPSTPLLVILIPVFWLLFISLGILLLRARSRYLTPHLHAPASTKKSFLQKLSSGFINTLTLENFYHSILSKIIAHKKHRLLLLICIVIIAIFSFSLPLTGLVKNEFFPAEESDSFSLQLVMPPGTSQQRLDAIALELLPQFAALPDLDYVTAQTGRGDSSMQMSGNSNATTILFTFNLIPEDTRSVSSIALATDLRRQWQNNNYGEATVIESGTITGFGEDIELGLIGPEIDVLYDKSEQVIAWLNARGIYDINSSLSDSSKSIVFHPNQIRLANLGLTSNEVGLYLRSAISGWSLGTLRQSGEELDITLRQQSSATPTIDDLGQIFIPTMQGNVPLTALGEFRLEPSSVQILRYKYNRVVTISGAVPPQFNANQINQELLTFVQQELNLPADYLYETRGVQAANAEALNGINLAMIIAALLILFTLVLQLRSFRKAFIVMSVIPVAISGVFIVFALFRIPLSLPASIGLLALFGIVVNNSILIVDKINQNLAAGQEFNQAIVAGATSRLQPIFLTSLTTIIGLIPITLSDPMWEGLGGAIIAGLIFSGTLLLLYIPTLFAIMFHPQKLHQKDQNWHNFLHRLSHH
jgi:multidrug efflux pump subunit AcrB